jgi:signal transduction histidine kinase/ligand-binding sensor domain-containing protein
MPHFFKKIPALPKPIRTKNAFGRDSMKSRTFLLIFLFLSASSISIAQVYPFDHYTSRDGLLMDYVIALCCDSRGYIWVGTNDGVSIYDGDVFKNYTVADGLAYSRVNCITESRKHPRTLWIGTNGGGVSKWKANKFQTYRIGGAHKSNIVTSLVEDAEGTLWCGTDYGLFQLIDDVFTPFFPSIFTGTVVGVSQTSDGTLWVLMPDRLYSISLHSSSPQRVKIRFNAKSDPECIHASSDTTLLIGMSDGEIVQMRGGKILRRDAVKNTGITFILDDRDGFLAGTTNGVYRLPKKGKGPVPLCSTSNGLPENFISTGAFDLEGDLWLGLGSKGIAKLANRSVFTYPVKDLIFPSNHSGAAMDSAEHLWVVSEKGIRELWKRKNNLWQSTLHNELARVTRQKPFTLLFDPPSHLWAGFDGGDIVCFTLSSQNEAPSKLNVLYRWRQGKEYRAGGTPMFLYKDKEGYYWCSVSDNLGVYLFDPKRKKPFVRSYMAKDGMPDNSVRAIFEDRDGNFWLGGYDNGLTFLPADKKFLGGGRRFTTEDGLPNMSIRSILQDSSGVIWVGTRYGGVAYLQDSTFHSLSLKDGLLSTAVWSMINDADGHQWLGTQLGFQEMTTKGSIKLFSKKELSGPPVYACGEMKDKTLWLITDAGVTFYDRRNDLQSNVPPPIYISRVLVSGVEVNPDSSRDFAYDQNNLSIDVIGLSLKDEKAVRYQYQLVGIDTGWSVPTRNHLIVFAALSPGTYTFMARAINGSGIESPQPAMFSFTIAPALWRQWWFITFSVILVIAVFFGVLRSRVVRLLEIERIKSRIAADLHDEIGAGLTRIAILSSVLERDLPQKENFGPTKGQSVESLKKIGDTARDLVESMSDVVWSLGLTEEPFERLVQRLRSFAFEACEAKDIVLKFSIDERIFALHVVPEIARNILLCAKEAITNVVRHSECSEAGVEFTLDPIGVTLKVADNGKGFHTSETHSGHGLTNMKKRAERSGGSFEMISKIGEGTRIRATFPAAR